jgi:hypothetical protein
MDTNAAVLLHVTLMMLTTTDMQVEPKVFSGFSNRSNFA